MGYVYPSAEYIDDTAAHTGRFGKVVALENTVIASMTADDITGNTLSAAILETFGFVTFGLYSKFAMQVCNTTHFDNAEHLRRLIADGTLHAVNISAQTP